MTVLSVPQIVSRAKDWIIADMIEGRVPLSVDSFSDLHDHVDANEYLQIEGDDDGIKIGGDGYAEPESHKRWLARLNAASDKLDEWIADGSMHAEAHKAEHAWLDAHLRRVGRADGDWITHAWLIDRKGRKSRYLADTDSGYSLVEQTTDDDGDGDVQELKSFRDFQEAKKWVDAHLRSKR